MYLTINSEFKPFTYDELVKPLQDYTEAYNKVEEQYSTLAQQTEAWKNIATQENSPEAYAMYKKYSDELNAMVEDFSRGMTIQNRRALSGLKSRYASEITPIANAYNSMKEANKYRDDVRAKDPTAVFIKNRYSSIDDFLNGKTADNNYISGEQIEASILGKTYAKANEAFTELTKDGIVNADTAARLVMSGQSFDINNVINEELESVGADRFDPESRQMLESYIASGVEKGFGSFIEKQTLTAAQRASLSIEQANLDERKRQFEIELATEGYNKDGSININSPAWSIKGIKFIDNGDGTISGKSINGSFTVDGSLYFSQSGDSFVYDTGKVKSTKIQPYNELKSKGVLTDRVLQKVYGEKIINDLPTNAKIEVISLINGSTMYRLHSEKKAKIKTVDKGTYDPAEYK